MIGQADRIFGFLHDDRPVVPPRHPGTPAARPSSSRIVAARRAGINRALTADGRTARSVTRRAAGESAAAVPPPGSRGSPPAGMTTLSGPSTTSDATQRLPDLSRLARVRARGQPHAPGLSPLAHNPQEFQRAPMFPRSPRPTRAAHTPRIAPMDRLLEPRLRPQKSHNTQKCGGSRFLRIVRIVREVSLKERGQMCGSNGLGLEP